MAMSAGAGGKVEEPSASGALGVSDSEERIAVLPPRLLQEGPGKLTPVAVLTGHTDRVWHVSFHPKHELLASCSGDKTVRLWEPEPSSTPKAAGVEPRWRCVEVLEGVATRTIRVCEWSPDGRFLATCSFDGAVRVWEVNIVTGGRVKSELVATLEGHENEVKGVAWSADGTLLASCGRDKSVWIWDATEVDEGGEYECVEVLHGHSQDVKCVTFHPSRSLLVSCGYDDSVKVWEEVEEDWVCSSTLTGHTSTVWQTAFEPSEGNRLVSCSDDLGLRVWHWFDGAGKDGGGTFKCTAVLPKVHSRTIFSCVAGSTWSCRGVCLRVCWCDVTGPGDVVGCCMATAGLIGAPPPTPSPPVVRMMQWL